MSPAHLWHYHQETHEDPQTKIQAAFLSLKPPIKSPSKQRHDRERSIRRDRIFQERRQQRLRLFGYVLLKNGEVLSIDDALTRLHDGLGPKENPSITGGIGKDDILDWHAPETYRDVLDSIGEIDALQHYPALGVFPGVVLLDPKLRHRDPALRR